MSIIIRWNLTFDFQTSEKKKLGWGRWQRHLILYEYKVRRKKNIEFFHSFEFQCDLFHSFTYFLWFVFRIFCHIWDWTRQFNLKDAKRRKRYIVISNNDDLASHQINRQNGSFKSSDYYLLKCNEKKSHFHWNQPRAQWFEDRRMEGRNSILCFQFNCSYISDKWQSSDK